MSGSFDPQDEQTLRQALKVQELAICGLDYGMYSTQPGIPIVSSDAFLGIAGNYGVLAASALTNSVGTSIINGNLGISPNGPSSVTGAFTVSGSSDEGNAAAALAQVAAVNAFNSLQTLGLAGSVIPSALDGQTLTPGAYRFTSGAASLAASGPGTLTLNGAGNYIIYTASTLTTGAGGVPTIALTGGATASKVYFVVGSSATINSGSAGTFNGNIIAHVSITDTMGGIVNGSLLANTGAITLSEPATVNVVSEQVSCPTINLSIYVNEPVVSVYNAFCKVDASNLMYNFNQAEISIIDSNLLTISSITAANPTIVTTTFPHFFYTKEQVQITGSNSTPSLDGIQAVTVTGPFTFALPLNVSVAGNAGSIDGDQPRNDYGVIQLLGLPGSAFNANDLVVVKYNTQPSKFYAQSLPTYNM
jgi:hypothetical protein